MEEETKQQLKELMLALEKIQIAINDLKLERDRIYQKFKDTLPAEKIMKIVK